MTQSNYTNYRASVAQANTPETDAMDKVLHTVQFRENGVPQNVQLLATDPMDAIRKLQRLHRADHWEMTNES